MFEKLHYEVFGEGKIIIFLHGFMEDLSIWKNFDFEHIEAKKILIDLPGHGLSTFYNSKWKNLKDIAKYILLNCKELKENKNEKIDIIGHSLGGYIAIELHKLLKNPGKLIFYHSHYLGDSDERKKNRDRAVILVKENKNTFIRESIPLLFSSNNRKKDYIKDLVKKAIDTDTNSIIFFLMAMKNRKNESEYITKIKDSVFFIHGEYDTLLTENELNTIKNLFNVTIIKNVSHMSFLENKSKSSSEIKKIFKKN